MDERIPERYDTTYGNPQPVRRIGTLTTVDSGGTLFNPRDSISAHSTKVGKKNIGIIGGIDDLDKLQSNTRSLSLSTVLTGCSCYGESLEKARTSSIDAGEVPSLKSESSLLNRSRIFIRIASVRLLYRLIPHHNQAAIESTSR